MKPVIGLIVVWAGDPVTGNAVIDPLRRVAKPIADVVRPVPYLSLQSMLDGGAPHGIHYYWKSHRLHTFDDRVMDVILGCAEALTSPLSQIGLWLVGGAVSRVPRDATAVDGREAGFETNVTAAWPPSNPDSARHIAWVRNTWDVLRPFSAGVYANFLSDEGAEGVEAAYGARLARLTDLKDRWDPTNFFRMNANITPRNTSLRAR